MLFILMVVPLVIGLIGLAIGKGKVTLKELLVQEGVIIVFVLVSYGVSYLIAVESKTGDWQVINTKISKKEAGWGRCCHSYPCHPHRCMCDSKGRNCSTCYDTCYRHSRDMEWHAYTPVPV